MRVINLQAWAGGDFSHLPGDVIELQDEIAQARIEAGLAAPVDDAGEVPQTKKGKKAKKGIDE